MTIARGYSVEQFHEQGYTGPVQIFSVAEAAELRARFYATIGQSEAAPGATKAYLSAWHHQHRWAYNVATDERVLDLIAPLLGPDIVMWAMHFWYKPPHNTRHLPWHQDANYWPMEPRKNVSAWIALGPTFVENGCLRILPGTQRQLVAHRKLDDPTAGFREGLPPEEIDESRAVDLEMQPGEVVIFNEATFHGSKANTSDVARVACSIRYTSPDVRFLMEQWSDPERIRTFLVRGEDTHHRNDAIRGTAPDE
jgi:ectoine hydroxylase-related dioxygenase (phytanoyl-CoA dioxygenase family)